MTNKGQAPPQELFFRLSGLGDSPWEIGRAQPAIIKLVEQGVFSGQILDIGCGIGDNAVYIADHAKDIKLIAIDLVPRAVEVAREKAKIANVNIEFEVVDMLADLSTTNLKQNSFDVILDSAIFHGFSDDDRLRYLKNIEHLIKPNGLYIQIVFSEKETREGGPRRITKIEIDELFSLANGWKVESTEDIFMKQDPVDSWQGVAQLIFH